MIGARHVDAEAETEFDFRTTGDKNDKTLLSGLRQNLLSLLSSVPENDKATRSGLKRLAMANYLSMEGQTP